MRPATNDHDTRWHRGKRRRDGEAADVPCHRIVKGVEGSASEVENSPSEDGTADLATCNGGGGGDRTTRAGEQRSL
jgi:hypothetical protein